MAQGNDEAERAGWIGAPMQEAVQAAFLALPASIRPTLFEIRSLIFETAISVNAGQLTETLKWGEPAYLTEISRSGTTIRLGTTRGEPLRCAVFFNCKTSLVDSFRERFSDAFGYEGNRALILPDRPDWSRAALSLCLAEALTYHRSKLSRAAVLPAPI
jgi:Domain of unknown function (DU1801).